jgi:hypothetical protein
MAPTEMIQTDPQMAQAQQTTPPSSPASNPILDLDRDGIFDLQAPAPAPATNCTCSHTSAESQTLQASAQPLTVEHLEQLISKLIDAKSKPPKASKDAKPGDPQPETARASKLEFKTVIEVYVSNEVLIKRS